MLKSTNSSSNYSKPYKALYESLWKCKKQRSEAESKNALLKAKFNQKEKASKRPKNNTQFHRNKQNAVQLNENNSILSHPVIQNQRRRYQRLYQKTGFVEGWLRDTNKNIEQKKYQSLMKQTKKLQSKLAAMSQKAKRAEARYEKCILKQSNPNGNTKVLQQNNQENIDADLQCLQDLQNLKNELEQEYTQLCEQINSQGIQIRFLRKEVIILLNEKNSLRKMLSVRSQ